MKICVIGIGYIGLPTACILSSKGFNVVAIDINEKYLKDLKEYKFKSKEKDLVQLFKQSLESQNFSLKTYPEKADAFIVCTPTPLDDNNNPDLSYLVQGVNSIMPLLDKDNMIIIESTIPPGTINNIIRPIIELSGLKVGLHVFLAYCPERVIPGNIVYEFYNNNRIIGGCTNICGITIAQFYSMFVKGEIFVTKAEVAEMIKLVENSYRDVNIALSNEISIICNELSIDPYEVIRLANKHPRVNLSEPGIGVGGHCLPVDPYFIVANSPNNSKLIQTSRWINDNMPEYVVLKIEKILSSVNNPKIGVWGIAYKANSDDIRNSPAMKIVSLLKEKGYNLSLYDPLVTDMSSDSCKANSYINSNLLLILVDHDEFKVANYSYICALMKEPIIFDATNKCIDKSQSLDNIVLYSLANI